MALPMNTQPTFNMTIPSSGKVVRFRPFVVKEEKALLIAQQSEDPKVMVDTLKNVFTSVIQDNFDVDKLAIFDIEYMFLQIRGKSVGETIDLLFQCDDDHGEQNEKARSKITINISDLNVVKPEGHTNKIELFNKVGLIMKYPTLETQDLLKDADDIEQVFDLVADLIDCIYDGEDVYYGHETKREELLQFLNNLTTEQFGKIQKFFETMPKISTKVEYKCPICGKEHHKVLEGLQSFF
jgi:hypothetical protein